MLIVSEPVNASAGAARLRRAELEHAAIDHLRNVPSVPRPVAVSNREDAAKFMDSVASVLGIRLSSRHLSESQQALMQG